MYHLRRLPRHARSQIRCFRASAVMHLIHSMSASVVVQVAWLWQEPLPRVDELLLEIGGAGYAQHLIARLRQRGYLQD